MYVFARETDVQLLLRLFCGLSHGYETGKLSRGVLQPVLQTQVDARPGTTPMDSLTLVCGRSGGPSRQTSGLESYQICAQIWGRATDQILICSWVPSVPPAHYWTLPEQVKLSSGGYLSGCYRGPISPSSPVPTHTPPHEARVRGSDWEDHAHDGYTGAASGVFWAVAHGAPDDTSAKTEEAGHKWV